jgi:hypothetical protein
MTDAAHLPFWRRKRWIAAGLLLFLFVYPLSAGVMSYLGGLRWLPGYSGMAPWPPAVAAYAPLLAIPECPPKRLWMSYVDWAYHLGERHARD